MVSGQMGTGIAQACATAGFTAGTHHAEEVGIQRQRADIAAEGLQRSGRSGRWFKPERPPLVHHSVGPRRQIAQGHHDARVPSASLDYAALHRR